MELLNAIAMNKHEQAFVSLAKDTGASLTLDLTKEGMKNVQARTQHIAAEYAKDYPPKPANELTPVTMVGSSNTSGDAVKVRLTNTIESETDYEARLAEWSEQNKKSEVAALKNYILSRVVFVVSKYESDSLVAALGKVPLVQEPGRKLFKYDSLVMDPMDWKKLKQQKRMFPHAGGKVSMTLITSGGSDESDTLAPLKNTYSMYRSMKDGKSCEDIVAVVLPGAGTDVPENVPLTKAFNSLRMLNPKHVGPKIGSVQIEQSDILRQMNARGALWRRKLENHLLFTYLCPPGAGLHGRKKMKYLAGGDTYFNNWPVPATPMANMAKCTEGQHQDIFRDDVVVDSGEEDGTMGADAQSLGDRVIPFPREHAAHLTQEMIHIWGIDLVIDLSPGSGQTQLAVILENIRGVCVAKNLAHKVFIMDTLMEKVRAHNLVRHMPTPKWPELAAWEAAHQVARGPARQVQPAAAATATPGLPSPDPIISTPSKGRLEMGVGSPAAPSPAPVLQVRPPSLAAFGQSRL